MHQIMQHQQKRDLVSVHRGEIDDYAIQGFILASSKQLVVLQYVYDFNLDGLMVIRTADITEVRCSATNMFQKELLEREGLIQRVPFGATFNLHDWRSVISELSKENSLMILECEKMEENIFVIGRVLETTTAEVEIQHFSGTARWERNPAILSFNDLTCCQVGTNYVNVYQRHFERHAP